MQNLLNKSFPAMNYYLTGSHQENTMLYGGKPEISKYDCSCCSYTLLRHISLERIFWRCSHCHQEMPVY